MTGSSENSHDTGEARLAGGATALLGTGMILAAIVGAIWILYLLATAEGGRGGGSLVGPMMIIFLGPRLLLAFVAGLLYRRAGRRASDTGAWTPGLWCTGLASLALAALMKRSMSRLAHDFFWDDLAADLAPLRYLFLIVLALHGLIIGFFGRPRAPSNTHHSGS